MNLTFRIESSEVGSGARLAMFWSLEREVLKIDGTLLVTGAKASSAVVLIIKLGSSAALWNIIEPNSISALCSSGAAGASYKLGSRVLEASSAMRTWPGSKLRRFHKNNSARKATQNAETVAPIKYPGLAWSLPLPDSTVMPDTDKGDLVEGAEEGNDGSPVSDRLNVGVEDEAVEVGCIVGIHVGLIIGRGDGNIVGAMAIGRCVVGAIDGAVVEAVVLVVGCGDAEGAAVNGVDTGAVPGDDVGAGIEGLSLAIINGEFVGVEIDVPLGGDVSRGVPSTEGDTVRSKNSFH